ncbi:MAG: flagellar biosynthesis anti-sigma factor FlgM [Tissierellia bacterium]|nr:flagellar biosynthesis anti-sigma factor FlgM [Tissierellia bacterium]
MKIQNINNKNYINYKSSSNEIKKEEINKENKYDVIELKGKNKENVSLQSIKKKVVSQINKETNADKINRIKDSIKNKTYSIDVEEIVKRLLK